MSDQYLGEIRPTAFNYAPSGWALCQGQLLSVQQYAPLYSLLGVQFGGNGVTNFALPNLQNTVILGAGSAPGLTPYVVGDSGGASSVNLTVNTIPRHSHAPAANASGGSLTTPKGTIWAAELDGNGGACTAYVAPPPNVMLPVTTIQPAGQLPPAPLPVNQPTLAVSYMIALTGEFPQRS